MPISIVIPVYNEEALMERNTKKLMQYLAKRRISYEILICDNGSTDKTSDIGNKLQKKYRNVRFFSIPRRGAVGWAFRKCVIHARYDKIVSVDMDLSVDLDFIPKCEKLLDDYALVVGSKQLGTQRRSFLRTFVSTIYITMTRVILGVRFSDYSLAAKGYRKRAIWPYLRFINKGTAYVNELIFFVSRKSRVTEVPVICDDRRRSRFSFVEEIIYRFRELMMFRIRVLLG